MVTRSHENPSSHGNIQVFIHIREEHQWTLTISWYTYELQTILSADGRWIFRMCVNRLCLAGSWGAWGGTLLTPPLFTLCLKGSGVCCFLPLSVPPQRCLSRGVGRMVSAVGVGAGLPH